MLIRLTTKIGPMAKIRDSKMWEETNRLRTEGARVLVDAAMQEGVPAYIHESVTFVYADGGSRWLTEDSRTDAGGGSILHATLEGEGEAERMTKEGGKGIVLRFGGFYGGGAPSTPRCWRWHDVACWRSLVLGRIIFLRSMFPTQAVLWPRP